MIKRYDPEELYIGSGEYVGDMVEWEHGEYVRYADHEAEVERLKARDEEWQRKASAWMASPEAAQRLDGYRELAQRLNAVETECDALRDEVELKAACISGMRVQAGKLAEERDALRADAERLDWLVRAADTLRNSTEEYECPDGMGLFALLDYWHEFDEALDAARGES